MPYKYKLKEMSKTASSEEAAKELKRQPGEEFKVGQVMYSDDGTRKSTITKIDSETGAVSWRIDQLPGFDKLYDEMDDLVDVAKRVYTKTKDDKKFREFYETARKLRNAIRTHLRNEYPDEYKNIVGVNEAYSGFLRNPEDPDSEPFNPTGAVAEFKEDLRALFGKFKSELNNRKFIGGVAEVMVNWKSLLRSQMNEEEYIVTGKKGKGEAQYGEPYKTREEAEAAMDKILKSIKKIGEKPDAKFGVRKGPLEEDDVEEISTSGAAGAYNTPYAFVRKPVKLKGKNKKKRYKYQMTKPSGLVGYMDNSVNEVIDLVHVYDKDGEIFGTGEIVQQFKDTAKVRFDGNFMGTFRNDRIKPVQESNDPGATLGPGPAAGPDGVTDSAYTKQFKYKLVPKNKNGTYVQKGSGLEVKKLF